MLGLHFTKVMSVVGLQYFLGSLEHLDAPLVSDQRFGGLRVRGVSF